VSKTVKALFGQVGMDRPAVEAMQAGIMSYSYRGVPMWKCPMDIAHYTQILWDLKPKTILEFGSRYGGSALWLADMLQVFGLSDTILRSYDIEPVTTLKDPRIEFNKVDVRRPHDFIHPKSIADLPRPLLIIDDASHFYEDVLTLLNFFHPGLRRGDYLIVEDGILDQLGWKDKYFGGPVRAIREFLDQHPDDYTIDRARCDAFGKNVTWNVEGYIERVR
jgi:cephalosporin hydroxylase